MEKEILEKAKILIQETHFNADQKKKLSSLLDNDHIREALYYLKKQEPDLPEKIAECLVRLLIGAEMHVRRRQLLSQDKRSAKKKAELARALLQYDDPILLEETRSNLQIAAEYYSDIATRAGSPKSPSFHIVRVVDVCLEKRDLFDPFIALCFLRAFLPENAWSEDTLDDIRKKIRKSGRQIRQPLSTPV